MYAIQSNSFGRFPFISFYLLYVLPSIFCQQYNPIVSPSNATKECLEMAQNSNCPIFTNCCQRKCPQGQGHKCMSFLGMIEKGQTACDCMLTSTRFPHFGQQSLPSIQWPSNFGDQFQTTKWPTNLHQGGQFLSSSSSQSPLSSSSAQQWPFSSQQLQFGQNMPPQSSPSQPSIIVGRSSANPGQNQRRPPAVDPASLRPIFQSIGQMPSSAAQCNRRKRWNDGGENWWRWTEFGRRADFVGCVLLLFIVDLLLLTFTL